MKCFCPQFRPQYFILLLQNYRKRESQMKLQSIQEHCVVQHDLAEQAHRRHNSF